MKSNSNNLGGGGGRGGTGGTQQSSQNSNSANQNPEVNQRYKTIMCRHFEKHGRCDLDKTCHFAHS